MNPHSQPTPMASAPRSCHTALSEIKTTFSGVQWVIEGDIKACFDSFDHHVLIDILRRRIKDEHFIALMWKMLKAGYMEQWIYHHTYSGTPQGSGVSPILANIYLSELDRYLEEHQKQFRVGTQKRKASRTTSMHAGNTGCKNSAGPVPYKGRSPGLQTSPEKSAQHPILPTGRPELPETTLQPLCG